MKGLQENKLSLRAVAVEYGIPHNHAAGKSEVGSASGPNTVLTKEEQDVVEWSMETNQLRTGGTIESWPDPTLPSDD